MAQPQPSDQFLINRNGVSYNVTKENLMAEIRDDDLMLVNRGNASYKVTGQEVKQSFVEPIVISSVTLTEMAPEVGDNIGVLVSSSGGKDPQVTTYQWQRDLVDISGETSITYTVVNGDIGTKLSCVVTISDAVGLTETQSSPQTADVKEPESVNTPTLLTPADGAGITDPDTALDPNDVHMTCTPFSGTGGATYKNTTWQITTDADVNFVSPIVNVTNSNETFYNARGLGNDITYRARVQHIDTNDIVSNFSEANQFKTQPSLVPVYAGEKSLRFSNNPPNVFNRALAYNQTWTISFWAKPTQKSYYGPGWISSSNANCCYMFGDCWQWYTSGGGNASTNTSPEVSYDEWQHIVYKCEANVISVSRDGGVFETCSGVNSNFGDTFSLRGGAAATNDGILGYLNQVYYVEGQALPPTTFGKSVNNGTWVPLPFTEVDSNIKTPPTSGGDPNQNTSQVWSNYLSAPAGYAIGTPQDAFNGDNSTKAMTPIDNPFIWTLPSPLACTSFGITTERNNSIVITFSNGSTKTYAQDTSNNVVEFLVPVEDIAGNGGGVSGFTLTAITTGSNPPYTYLYSVSASGKTLVDAAANRNAVWSTYASGAGLTNANQAFDGNTGTAWSADNNADVTWTPPQVLTGTTFTVLPQQSSMVVTITNTDGATFNATGGGSNVPFDMTFSGTIEKVVFSGSAGTWASAVASIAVDGLTLVDGAGYGADGFYLPFNLSTGIGTDGSGNNNNFTTANFAAGNADQIWSNYGSGPQASLSYSWPNLFDGILNTDNAAMPDFNSSIVWTLPVALGSTCALYINRQPNNEGSVTVNGSPLTVAISSGQTVDKYTINEPLSTFTIARGPAAGSGGNDALRIAGVEIDGKVLVDSNIQDTVIDIPTADYCVLSTNETVLDDGNLVTLGNQSNTATVVRATQVIPESNGKYYWELTFASGNSNTLDLVVGVDGVQSGSNLISLGSASPAMEFGDVVSVLYDTDTNNLQVAINGSVQSITPSGGTPQGGSIPYMTNAGTNLKIIANFGQQPFTYAVNNLDGTAAFGGETYKVIFNPIAQQAGDGALYFDTHTTQLATALQIANRYGLKPSNFVANKIYDLKGTLATRIHPNGSGY